MGFVVDEKEHCSKMGSPGFARWPRCSQAMVGSLTPTPGGTESCHSNRFRGLHFLCFKGPPGLWGLWLCRAVPRAGEGTAFPDHCPGPSRVGSVLDPHALASDQEPAYHPTSHSPLGPMEPCPLARRPRRGTLPKSF